MFLCPVLGLASRNVNQERRFSFGVESSTRTEPLTPRNKVIQRIEYSNFLFSWPSRQMYKGNQIKIRIFLCECGAGGARGFGGLEIPKSRNRGCPTPPSVPSGCRLQGWLDPSLASRDCSVSLSWLKVTRWPTPLLTTMSHLFSSVTIFAPV